MGPCGSAGSRATHDRRDAGAGAGVFTLPASVGDVWKSDVGEIDRWVGFKIPCQSIDTWICPTYQPSWAYSQDRNKAVSLVFRRHIAEAVALVNSPRPTELVDPQPEMILEHSPRLAAVLLRGMVQRGGPLVIDYETNRLKPDHPNARIVSAAVNWRGKKVVAFPFHGEAVDAWRELVWSPHPKIAANAKFEQRWTRKVFGRGVRNWAWDTMQTAHNLDNRPGITSVKFCAFVHLGESAYDDHIEQFLEDSDESGANNIADIEIGQLLKYNADDVRVEWGIAKYQMPRYGLSIERGFGEQFC